MAQKEDYYRLLGIQPWQSRQTSEVISFTAPACGTTNLSSLAQSVANCTACGLHATRTQTVFGVGNPQARLMVIGEAPGMNEDLQGEPFVGRGGQLLTAMLQAIGLQRSDVYIANILKCRPPNNRDPLPEEVASCTTFLDQQIALIKPQLMLAVGRIAAHYLLKTKSSLESLRNQTHQYGECATPLIVTYHPAYLLRNPADKKKAFVDLQFVQRTLRNFNHGSVTSLTGQTI
jgi:uracil-DNA glycosylase family 4